MRKPSLDESQRPRERRGRSRARRGSAGGDGGRLRRGRPSKLDGALEAELCARVRAGASWADAAALVGVSRSTLGRWLAEGRRPGAPARLAGLVAALERAQAEARLVPWAQLQRAAARGRWRAAAAFLERRFPEDWALDLRGDAARRRRDAAAPASCAGAGEAAASARSEAAGVPARLTAELEARLCEALRLGAWPAEAAAYAGISRSTLYRWRRAGEAPDAEPRLAAFAAALRRAEAEARLGAFAVIRSAAARDWRAAAWLLERLDPDQWGPLDRFGRRRYRRRPDDDRIERIRY